MSSIREDVAPASRTRRRASNAVRTWRALVAASVALALPVVPASTVGATFPGANGKILFASTRDGGDTDLFSMNPDGTDVTNLTSDSGVDDRLGSWSADGTKIAYTSAVGGGDFEIMVMNVDGSGKTQLTDNAVLDQEPAFTPDGGRIAFGSQRDGGDFDVFVMNADGTGAVNLTPSSGADDYGPAFSPDGGRIAFTSTRDGNYEIYVMDADGSGQTRLTTEGHQDVDPEWSPDGETLLFRRDLGHGAGWGETMRIDADGTGLTNLTNTATIWEDGGHYSPDGTKIVFSSNQNDPAFEIWVMDADGTDRVELTAGAAGGSVDVDWGVDGPVSVEGDPLGNQALRATDHALRFDSSQDRSDVGDDHVVWRDFRGDSDDAAPDLGDYLGRIWSKDLADRSESPVSSPLATDDPNPRVSGGWAVWTDHSPDPDGDGPATSNDDIYACQLPCTAPFQVTTHAAHQMNPAISGNTVVWEDFRNCTNALCTDGNIDLYKKKLPSGPDVAVTTDPGDQVSPSFQKKQRSNPEVVAWRHNGHPSGLDEADVYVKVGGNPPLLIADSEGNGRPLSEFQVAVSSSQVMWNETDPACAAPVQEGDPENPDDDVVPCNLPRLLKTASFSGAAVTAGPSVVDTAPTDGFATIADLDMSGSRGVWSRSTEGASHAYTRDPVESGPIVPVDDTESLLGGSANGVRVDGTRFAWTQTDHGTALPGGREDIYWRELTSQPRRVNSISLGGFGGHFNPIADGDLVVYGRGPSELPGTALVTGGDEIWATDLGASGARRHFRISRQLGTGFARPAIVGNRVVWRACQPQDVEQGGNCGPMFQTEVDIAAREPGPVKGISDVGGPDADGSLTAWRCGDTEICVRDEGDDDAIALDGQELGGNAMRTYDVSAYFTAAGTADPDDLGQLSDNVRISTTGGGAVVWHELHYDPDGADPEPCGALPDCSGELLHVLDVSGATPTDEVVATSEFGATSEFDISGTRVVWASGDSLWQADLSTLSVADWAAPDCNGADTCPEKLVRQENHGLRAPSLDGTRVAWVAEDFAGECCTENVYTLEIGVDDQFHFVAGGAGFPAQPYVDGERIYWSTFNDVFVMSTDPDDPVYDSVDTAPPSPAANAAAVAFGGAVEVSWDNPGDDDFYRVRVLRTTGPTPPGLEDASGDADAPAAIGTVASVVYEGSGTAFTDTDVVRGVQYSYSIFAFDYEPNFAPAATTTVTAG